MLNFSPSGRLREKDGGECFAPFAFALLRAEMLQNGGQDCRKNQKFKKILNLADACKTTFLIWFCQFCCVLEGLTLEY